MFDVNEFKSQVDSTKKDRAKAKDKSIVHIAQDVNNPWPLGGGLPFHNKQDAIGFTNSKSSMGTNSVITVKIGELLV